MTQSETTTDEDQLTLDGIALRDKLATATPTQLAHYIAEASGEPAA